MNVLMDTMGGFFSDVIDRLARFVLKAKYTMNNSRREGQHLGQLEAASWRAQMGGRGYLIHPDGEQNVAFGLVDTTKSDSTRSRTSKTIEVASKESTESKRSPQSITVSCRQCQNNS